MERFPDVMILAAGLGAPLHKVAGKPLLDRVALLAHAEGATRFVVTARAQAAQVKSQLLALEASVAGTSFALAPGETLADALPLLETDPVLVMEGTGLWRAGDRPLQRMVEAYAGQIVLLCVHPFRAVGFARRSHDFCLAPGGEVTGDSGAPVLYAGAALVPRALLGTAPLPDLFDAARECGELRGVALGTDWLHTGTPDALAEAEKRFA